MRNIIVPVSRVEYGGGEKIRNAVIEDNLFHMNVNILASRKRHPEIRKKWGFTVGLLSYWGFFTQFVLYKKESSLLLFGHNLLLVFLCRIGNIKVIMCVRKDFTFSSKKLSFRLAMLMAKQVIMQHNYTGASGSNIQVILNFCENSGRYIPNTRGTIERIGIVGRLDQNKNVLFAIETILKGTKDSVINVYGIGTEYNILKAKYLNSARVNILGMEDSKKKIYSSMDVLVLSSMREGVPNVLIEALSYGIPVVFSEFSGGGWREFDLDHWCYSYKVNNSDELINALKQAAVDCQYRSIDELQRFMKKFDEKLIMNSWRSILS